MKLALKSVQLGGSERRLEMSDFCLAPSVPPLTEGHQWMGMFWALAIFSIWEFNWSVNMRITPFDKELKPRARSNTAIPPAKNRRMM